MKGKDLLAESFSANYPTTLKNQSQPLSTQMLKRELSPETNISQCCSKTEFTEAPRPSPVTNAQIILVRFLLENAVGTA